MQTKSSQSDGDVRRRLADVCACVGMPVASRRAIDGGGQHGGWGIKENHLHLSDSSNLKFLQDSLDTVAILLKWRS